MQYADDKYISYTCTKCGYKWAIDSLMYRTRLPITKTKPKIWYTKAGHKIVKRRQRDHCWCELEFPKTEEECRRSNDENKA